METQHVLLAFALTLFAGLSTGIGGLVSLIAKRANTRFLCASLGFSAGIMIYVSFMEMMPEARAQLAESYGEKPWLLYLVLAFFGGIALINLIDFLVPESLNPHEMHGMRDDTRQAEQRLAGRGFWRP